MKRHYQQALFAASLGLFSVCGAGSAIAQADPFGSNNLYYNNQYNNGDYTNPQYDKENISYNDFYTNLAPYGQWIEDEHYGFVWSPNVDVNFRPYYTNGHWALTDYGNTWVSDYQWGWACFHYGRWVFDTYYGWLWVPGTTWGPAWVSWRSGTGTFGWAPLSPEYEFTASDLKAYHPPKDWWVFLPPQYLYGGNYYRFLTGPFGNTVMKGTKVVDNTYITNGTTFVAGPNAKQIEAVTNKPVQHFHLLNSGAPKASYTHNDQIKMYRPNEIKKTLATGEQPIPPNAVKAPRAVLSTQVAINTNSGGVPAFRNDMKDTPPIPVVSAGPAPRGSSSTHKAPDEIRADKNTYQSSVKVFEPQRTHQANGSLTPVKRVLPPQQSQTPEPVNVTNKNEDARTTVRQHADPVPTPAQQEPQAPRSEPIPAQHAEPISPTRK